MARTFDIRFDAAANSFGWRGGGQLSVDTQGLSFALKRGIASLLARRRSQRIPAERIIEVYREGDALRVEFATDDNPRVVLPFWARNRDAAAQIVQLLPTLRTIEIEDSGDEARDRKVARRTPLMLAAAMVLVLASGALFIAYQRPVVVAPPVAVSSPVEATPPASTMRPPTEISATSETAPALVEPLPVETESSADGAESVPTAAAAPAPKYIPMSDRFTTPEEARKLATLAEDPVDWTSPPLSSSSAVTEAAARAARVARIGLEGEPEAEGFVPMEVPEIHVPIAVVPIPQTSLAYETAREMLNAFEVQARQLTEHYRSDQASFVQGTLDPRLFANLLDANEIRWHNLSDHVLGTRKYADPELTGMRATLLSVVISQRVFLTGYAAGLRAGDQARIDRAFRQLANAEEELARARQYLN